MHLHLRGAQRRLNAGDLLGIDIAFVVHAQYLRQGTTQLQVAAAQLAQRLLEQPLPVSYTHLTLPTNREV